MKKQNLISILLFAVIIFAVVFSCLHIALADEVDLVFPNKGYLQAKNVDCIGVSSSLTVTADNENKVVTFTGSTCGSVDFSGLDDSMEKLFVYSNTAIAKGGKGFYRFDFENATVVAINEDVINDDCYLATDGTLLYVHQYGSVTTLDESLKAVATYTDSIFNNKPVLTVIEGVAYGFVVEHGVSRVYTYDFESKVAESFIKDTAIMNAIAGDTIYGFNGENIILIDRAGITVDNGKLKYTLTDLNSQNYTAFGNRLYIAKSSDGYDEYIYESGGLTFLGNHSFAGDGPDKLNAPFDSVQLGGETVISDTANNRLLFVGDTVASLEMNAPTALTVGNGKLYVLTLDGIAVVENKTISYTVKTNLNPIDLIYSDGLYVLTENGVYVLVLGSLHKVFDVNGGKSICCNGLYYVLTDSGVVALKSTNNGLEKNVLLSFEADGFNPIDILADVVGNVYLLGDDNAIHCFNWQDIIAYNIEGTPLVSTDILIESSTYDFNAKSMSLMGDKIVITTKENTLVSMGSPLVKTKQNSTSVDTANAIVSTYTTTDKSYFMPNENDGTSTTKVAGEKHLVCYEFEDMLYTSLDGVKGWIFNAEKTSVSTDCAGVYIAKTDITLYENPMFGGGVSVVKDTVLSVIDNGGGYGEGNWVRVEYQGKIYYAEKGGLQLKQSASTPTPETQKPQQTEKVSKEYGRAKASRAGELVFLYSTDGKTVVAKVADGTRLEVVEKVGNFYKVKYNGAEVLIHRDQFKLDGLTTVQIVAIILSVVVVLAGGLIFMVTSLSKKKEENQDFSTK